MKLLQIYMKFASINDTHISNDFGDPCMQLHSDLQPLSPFFTLLQKDLAFLLHAIVHSSQFCMGFSDLQKTAVQL